jgi:hypothetical protein
MRHQVVSEDGYEVTFDASASYTTFSVRNNGALVAKRDFWLFPWRRGPKWALRQIKAHRRAMRTLDRTHARAGEPR